ncbi:hypothetical protein C8R46DRAFT_1135285, partial [Mycena filopes]
MDPTSTTAAVEAARETFVNNCATAAFIVILVYDWLLTLGVEIDYIWRQKMSWGKLLYFINRYLVIIDLVILLNCICVPWFHIDSWLGVLSIVSIDTIMLVRAWAMWQRSKRVLVLLLSLQVVFTMCLKFLLPSSTSPAEPAIPSPNNIRPCLTGFARPDVLYALWMGVVVWDLTIMVATLMRAIPTIRLDRSVAPIISLILRDGIQYFVLMLLIALGNIVVINKAPGPLATMLLTLQRVTNSVIGSRIMLNLRGMLLNPGSHRHQGETAVTGLPESTIELMPPRGNCTMHESGTST